MDKTIILKIFLRKTSAALMIYIWIENLYFFKREKYCSKFIFWQLSPINKIEIGMN